MSSSNNPSSSWVADTFSRSSVSALSTPEMLDTGYEEIDDTVLIMDYFKVDFTLAAGGVSTLELREKVTIYDVSHLENPTTDIPDPIEDSGIYKDPGYLGPIPTITGTVMNWDLPNLQLKVGDISDMDPEQEDRSDSATKYDVIINKMANVLIVGEESWRSLVDHCC